MNSLGDGAKPEWADLVQGKEKDFFFFLFGNN